MALHRGHRFSVKISPACFFLAIIPARMRVAMKKRNTIITTMLTAGEERGRNGG